MPKAEKKPRAKPEQRSAGVAKKERSASVKSKAMATAGDSYGKRTKWMQAGKTLDVLRSLKDGQLMVVEHADVSLAIVGNANGIRWLDFAAGSDRATYKAVATPDEQLIPCMAEGKRQLLEYFEGARKVFHLKLNMSSGTAFQRSVWNALSDIPYGQALSYGEVAKLLGKPTAYRAVANACKSNPVGLIVPCHRVVGKNCDLVGFGGGVCLKGWLLEHEGWTKHKNKGKHKAKR